LDIADGLGPGSVTLLKTQTEVGMLFIFSKIDSVLFHFLQFFTELSMFAKAEYR
jgi:hypothetical protein